MQLKLDRLETEKSLAANTALLEEAKTTFPINAKLIVELHDKVTKQTNGIEFIDKLAKELGLRDEDLNEQNNQLDIDTKGKLINIPK